MVDILENNIVDEVQEPGDCQGDSGGKDNKARIAFHHRL